mgnify:CR=1 FL=1
MEVGGRQIVDAVSFTVMSREKVGLVGRNGAGKTSLFKVLGGAAEPMAGKVICKGGFGYLPQDPRIEGVLDTRPAVTHVLSGRAVDDRLDRIDEAAAGPEDERHQLQGVGYRGGSRRTRYAVPPPDSPRRPRPCGTWHRPGQAGA